jgi:hypothetical protein
MYNNVPAASKDIRKIALDALQQFEKEFSKIGGRSPGIPLADRWICHKLLDEVIMHQTRGGEQPAMHFTHPFNVYYQSDGEVPADYTQLVPTPMDLGTVTASLHLGEYKTFEAFVNDVHLIFANCKSYWHHRPEGMT